MELYVTISVISIFSLFLVLGMILSDALILPISQLQTQQVMTSQIRSRIEYLIQTIYSCAHFVIEIGEKSSHNGGVLMRFNDE